MNQIIYPCKTAVIYGDTIFPISLESKASIGTEVDAAVRWFCRWFGKSEKQVRKQLLVSLQGLYLSYEQAASGSQA